MSLYHLVRPIAKYLQSAWRWKRLGFGEAPPIFGNAKPKSGSHLLTQILNGFCQIAPYAYVQTEPIRTVKKEGGRWNPAQVAESLQKIPAGVIGWGYVDATPENLQVLLAPGRVNYFLYRDPRDMLISHVFYATDMHEGHGMHEYYQALSDFNERLKVAITGIDRDGLYMVDVKKRYEGVFEWLEKPQVHCLRFEDLLHKQTESLSAMLGRLEESGYSLPHQSRAQALQILTETVQPKRSKTFRSGKTGEWKKYFQPEHKALFKEMAGDLLIRLGYEENNDW